MDQFFKRETNYALNYLHIWDEHVLACCSESKEFLGKTSLMRSERCMFIWSVKLTKTTWASIDKGINYWVKRFISSNLAATGFVLTKWWNLFVSLTLTCSGLVPNARKMFFLEILLGQDDRVGQGHLLLDTVRFENCLSGWGWGNRSELNVFIHFIIKEQKRILEQYPCLRYRETNLRLSFSDSLRIYRAKERTIHRWIVRFWTR